MDGYNINPEYDRRYGAALSATRGFLEAYLQHAKLREESRRWEITNQYNQSIGRTLQETRGLDIEYKQRRLAFIRKDPEAFFGKTETLEQELRRWQTVYNATEQDPLTAQLFPQTPERQRLKDKATKEIARILDEMEGRTRVQGDRSLFKPSSPEATAPTTEKPFLPSTGRVPEVPGEEIPLEALVGREWVPDDARYYIEPPPLRGKIPNWMQLSEKVRRRIWGDYETGRSPITATNRQTGKKMISYDGGRSWQKLP